jgi:hypothetical protein
MRQRVTTFLICLAAAGLVGCQETPDKASADVKPVTNPKKLTAAEINSIYQRLAQPNGNAGFGTIYEVTGRLKCVEDITPQNAQQQEILTAEVYLPDYAAVTIRCWFPLDQKVKVAAWQKGQTVTVRGKLWSGPMHILTAEDRSVLHLNGCLPVERREK